MGKNIWDYVGIGPLYTLNIEKKLFSFFKKEI